MSWPPSTDVLVASGVGAAVVLLALVAVLVIVVKRRRNRRRAADRPTVAHALATGILPRPDAADELPSAVADAPPPAPAAPSRPVSAPAPDARIAGSGAPLATALSRALNSRPTPRGDARDRLLAVLLDDPVRTVGAAAALEESSAQLSRLTAAVSHERGVLGTHLARLSAAGLEPEQLASLAGLPAAEIRELLAP